MTTIVFLEAGTLAMNLMIMANSNSATPTKNWQTYEHTEIATVGTAFFLVLQTAPDPPPKLASSLTNGRSHSKMEPPKEFGTFSALLAPALLSGKKNEEGETVRSTLTKKASYIYTSPITLL